MNIKISAVIVFSIFLFCSSCLVDDRREILGEKFSEKLFVERMKLLLAANKIDSLTFFKGLEIQGNSSVFASFRGVTMDSVIQVINARTEINARFDYDKLKFPDLNVLLIKKNLDGDPVDFHLTVELCDTENFRIGDELFFEIYHENLRGKVFSNTYVGLEVNEKFMDQKFKEATYPEKRSDFTRRVLVTSNPIVNILPDSIFVKYSSMKIVAYRHFRGKELITEILR